MSRMDAGWSHAVATPYRAGRTSDDLPMSDHSGVRVDLRRVIEQAGPGFAAG